MSELLILIESNLGGRVRVALSVRLTLDYENAWCESRQGYSLYQHALAEITYPQRAVISYLGGARHCGGRPVCAVADGDRVCLPRESECSGDD